MNKFTVEEICLITIYAGKSRAEVLHDIEKAMGYLEDEDLIELSKNVIAKLNDMSDEEFAAMEFVEEE